MSEEDAFLRMIRSEPDDDTPRLVFADWLEEHGQSDRAEFIRLQCEAERLRASGAGWEQARIPGARAQKLLARHSPQWLGRFQGCRRAFKRGFLDQICITAKSLVAHAEEVFRLGPITNIELLGTANYVAGVAAIPHLTDVKQLHLQANQLTGIHIRTLVGSSYVCELECLYLERNNIANEGVIAIAESPHLSSLTTLRIDHNDVGDEGLLALAESRYLPRLRGIYLSGNEVDLRRRGARALVDRFGEGVLD